MNCPHCQTPLPADAAFCPNCGKNPHASASGVRTVSGKETIVPIREEKRPSLEPGTLFAERYEVVRKLGEGGMGVVYVAKDTNTGEELVLKLIHPELVKGEDAIKRLLAEGLTARQIRHPNIVAVYDVAQYAGQPYFTMEYVKGGTLRNWLVANIANGRDVKVDTAAGIVRGILAGLGEAHRMGIVHRDLKPENVMIVGDPHAGEFNLKILDFGIAKAVGGTRGSGGGAIGTPLYMAPEQQTAADAVGPQADLYSVSVIFYEMLMEASPQARWEPISRSRQDVPAAIDALVEKGLSTRARSRPASVAEYVAALDAALAQPKPRPVIPDPPRPEPEPPGPGPIPDPIRPPVGPNAFGGMSKKTKMWLGIGAAVVVLGLIGSMTENETPVAPADADRDGILDTVDACPGEPGPAPTGCPPQVPPVVTERWRDDFGNTFEVDREGSTFSGDAFVPNTGNVEIDGSVSGTAANATIRSGQRIIYQGGGTIGPAQGGIDAVFGQFRFHINH